MASLVDLSIDEMLQRASRPKKAKRTELSDQDRESLLHDIGGGALSAVGYAGGVLDKLFGGRAIRAGVGLLTGHSKAHARDLLSVIPGSDTLGITDQSDAIDGRDLLDPVLGENKPGFDAGDVAGFGVNLLLDPIGTFGSFGLGAVGKGGRVAKAAGLLDDAAKVATKAAGKTIGPRAARMTTTLDDLVRAAPNPTEALARASKAASAKGINLTDELHKPLGGLMGMGVNPFGSPDVVLGTGQTAQKVAGAMDSLGAAVRYSAPVRGAARLFNPSVRETSSEAAQRIMPSAKRAAEAGLAEARQSGAGVYRKLAEPIEALQQVGLSEADAQSLLRQTVERTKGRAQDAITHEQALDRALAGRAIDPAQRDSILNTAKQMTAESASVMARKQQLGMGKSIADRYSEYLRRQRTPIQEVDAAGRTLPTKGSRSFGTATKTAMNREDALKNIPSSPAAPGGGTSGLEQMARDPRLVGAARLKGRRAQRYILRRYLAVSKPESRLYKKLEAKQAAGKAMTADELAMLGSLDAVHQQAKDLARFTKQLDERHLTESIPLFGRHVAADHMAAQMADKQAIAYADAVHDLLAGSAANAGDGVKAKDLFRSAARGGIGLQGPGAVQTFADRLVKAGKLDPGILSDLTSTDAKVAAAARGKLANMVIPHEVAADAKRALEFTSHPDALNGFLDFSDKLTNLYKTNLTSPFPGFTSRNFMTMLWRDIATGGIENPLNPAEWKRAYDNWKASGDLLAGKSAGKHILRSPHFRGMSEEQATRKLSDMLFAHQVAQPGETMQSLGAHAATYDTGDFAHELPGNVPVSPKTVLRDTVKDHGTLYPWQVRGSFGESKEGLSRFAAARFGERTNSYLENLGRTATFIRELMKGSDPGVAAAVSRGAHVDYAALTNFERKWMRRVAPFYTYSRRMIPEVLLDLARHPTGYTGASVKLTAKGSDPDRFAPPQVAGQAAIPLGDNPTNGTRRFLNLDLPHEMLNNLFQVRPSGLGTAGSSLLGYVSQMHPVPKGLAEIAFGKSSFQRGRPLADLYARLDTGSPLANAIVANTPASRYIGTVSQLLDERKSGTVKALNLLAGLGISDIDMPKARREAVAEYVKEVLRGHGGVRAFERLYVPADQRANMSQRELALLELLEPPKKPRKKKKPA